MRAPAEPAAEHEQRSPRAEQRVGRHCDDRSSDDSSRGRAARASTACSAPPSSARTRLAVGLDDVGLVDARPPARWSARCRRRRRVARARRRARRRAASPSAAGERHRGAAGTARRGRAPGRSRSGWRTSANVWSRFAARGLRLAARRDASARAARWRAGEDARPDAIRTRRDPSECRRTSPGRLAQRLPCRSMGAGARRIARCWRQGSPCCWSRGAAGAADRRSGARVAVDTSEPVPCALPLDLDRVQGRARRSRPPPRAGTPSWRRLRGVPSVGAALRRARAAPARSAAARTAATAPPTRAPARRRRAARRRARRRAGGGARLGRGARASGHALTAEPAAGGVPQPAPQHPDLDPGAVPGRRASGARSAAAPAVFQYVPGQRHAAAPARDLGLDQRAAAPLPRRGPGALPAAAAALRRQVDALARARRARAAASVAWEYYYRYAQGSPPWISGMAQATAVQALARGGAGARRAALPRGVARRALGAFRPPPPAGVAVPAAAGGSRYVMYSFAPTLQILNGELQAINGLRDAAVLRPAARCAARLVARGRHGGARDARRVRHRRLVALLGRGRGVDALLPPAHHRASSSTSAGGPSDAHVLRRRAPLRALRARAAADRDRAARAGCWARRAAPLRFSLSKGSAVAGPGLRPARGRAWRATSQLGRGGHDLRWTPPSRGRFGLRVSRPRAGGPARLSPTGRVQVVLPKPQPRRLAAQDDDPPRKPPKQLRGETRGGEVAAGLGG